jgi:ABC-type antimicrobial peptide transport system permease subunit
MLNWLNRLIRKRREEKLLDSELRFHVEQQIARHIAAGSSEQEARRRAQLEFGGLEQIKQDCREARRTSLVETLMQDARYGARMLGKNPGFATIAVLTLALGIGASTAVFSLVNAILLKPLPYPKPEQIVIPWLVSPPGVNLGSEYFPWGEIQFRMVTREQTPFQSLGAFQNDSFNLTGSGEPALLDGFRASSEFFPALGVSPALGRTYTAEEDQPGHEHEVLLSDQLWRERFGGDRNVLGRSMELNGYAYTIIGVMPAGFAFPRAEEMPGSFNFPREAQLWVPLAVATEPKGGPSELAVIARLKPGVTIEQAQAGMNLITKHAERQDPKWKGWFNARITPLTRQVTGDTRRPLQLILGAVMVVLLIACSNVANLLLARSLARKREFTLRAALGAGRGRLVLQLVALALVLVVSAGLLTRTFLRLLATDGGFHAEHVLTFQLSLPALKYADQPHIVSLYRNALERLRSIPGVQSAGIGETVPMGGEGESTVIRLPNHPASNSNETPFANYTIISPGYFASVGTAVLRGRDFLDADTADSMPVTIINLSMAKKYWPGEDPLGKQVAVGSTRYPLTTIVGIVADAKHISLREETTPEMYVPYDQKVWPSMLNMRVALRTKSEPTAMTGSVREAIRSLDPDLPLAKVATLTTLVDDSMTQPRFAMLALASFGVLALVLASIGMYGVISYSVSQRTQEIGIRIALGAGRGTVFAMVVGQGARLAGIGIAIGLLAALGVTRLMAAFLYGVQPTDPLTFVTVSLLLAAIALLACYVPAHRATRVDPMMALRYE